MLTIKVVFSLLFITSKYKNTFAIKFRMDRFEAMIHDLSKVLSDCKMKEMDNIGIITHSQSSLTWSSKFLATSTVINLKDTQTKGQFAWDVDRRLLRQKLHVFIIVASSPDNLRYLVGELKKTMWWNVNALFLLIDGQTLEKGCKNSYQYLSTSWAENMLSSTYVCNHPTKGPRMYTYNPYTQKAPYPWKVVGTNTMNLYNHTWTLLDQPLRYGRTSCKDLDFDKKADLGGFPFKVIGVSLRGFVTFDFSKQDTGLGMVDGFDGLVWQAIVQNLNATVNLHAVLNNTLHRQYAAKIMSGEYDILLNSLYFFNKPNFTMTYPHMDSGLSILTRYPGYEAAYTKILNFMNPKLLLGVLLVFTGTIIVLRVFVHEEIAGATLEVLRTLFGVSLLNFPTGNPMRIYLITVIVLFMLTASIFQSNLSSLLTSPVPKPLINTHSDLKESGFPLYLHRSHQYAIADEVLRSRMVLFDDWNCSAYVMKYENVACAMDRMYLQKSALENNLYMSEHRLSILQLAYFVRPNWPFVNEVSSMVNVFYEMGLMNHWYDMACREYNYKMKKMREEFKQKEFRIMNLEDLKFAFCILLVGNSVAFLVFLLEICFARYMTRNKIRTMKKLPVFPFTH